MSEGVRTLIRTPSELDDRLAMVRKDCAAILAHHQCLVTAASFVPRGTLEQGALFHLLCEHIAAWWNGRHSEQPTCKETVKRDLKVKYGRIETKYSPVTDQRVARLCSWSEYSKAERADLITATLAWMADNGVPELPDLPAAEYERYRRAAA